MPSMSLPHHKSSSRSTEKASDQCGDLVCGRVQCEMTGVEHVNLSVGHILTIGLWLREVERAIVSTPDHQHPRLLLAQPGLPLRVGVQIGSIVVEQLALNVSLAGLSEKGKFVGPEIWVIAFWIGIAPDMACPRRG